MVVVNTSGNAGALRGGTSAPAQPRLFAEKTRMFSIVDRLEFAARSTGFKAGEGF